jgi:hypothetical protein
MMGLKVQVLDKSHQVFHIFQKHFPYLTLGLCILMADKLVQLRLHVTDSLRQAFEIASTGPPCVGCRHHQLFILILLTDLSTYQEIYPVEIVLVISCSFTTRYLDNIFLIFLSTLLVFPWVSRAEDLHSQGMGIVMAHPVPVPGYLCHCHCHPGGCLVLIPVSSDAYSS